MDDNEMYRKAFTTCLDIVKDRDYSCDDLYSKLTVDEFKYLISSDNLNIIGKNNDLNKVIYIRFVTINKVRSALIKEIVTEISKEVSDTINYEIILVLKSRPTSIIKKIEKEFSNLQIMYCKQLIYNITKHRLVPKHTKLKPEEVNKLMNIYSISSKYQIPIILKHDPIARYYNFKSGDVLRIDTSLGSINSNYFNYRCVR